MSIPLVRNNTKDAINTSIIAIKKNLERINSLLGLADSSEPDLSGLATKQELEDAVTEINNTIDDVETSLQPVDTVASGDMHSVTSNAVAGAINNYRSNIGTWFTSNMKNAIVSSFNNASDYSLFSGQTFNDAECGWYGFKHNNTRGGCCIVMNERHGCFFGHGVGDPSTWNYHCIIESF